MYRTVQPLIVAELIFIPPFSALISHVKLTGRDRLAIVAITNIGIVFLSRSESGHGAAVEEAALAEEVTEIATAHHRKHEP